MMKNPFIQMTLIFVIFIVVYVLIMSWALGSSRRDCEDKGGEYSSHMAGKVIVAKCEYTD